jgi:hypothetical protein
LRTGNENITMKTPELLAKIDETLALFGQYPAKSEDETEPLEPGQLADLFGVDSPEEISDDLFEDYLEFLAAS